MNPLKLGYYEWSYGGGQFEVCLRPNGVFQCDMYQANGQYFINKDEKSLLIDWKNYGKYEFSLVGSNDAYDGSLKGEPANWRKIKFVKEFTETEKILLSSTGYGSMWNFQWQKGAFEVEFHGDSFNHFNCPKFPAHSHWSLVTEKEGTSGEPMILIDWGQYGMYEMRLDPTSKDTLIGNVAGNPSNWRKASFIRPLTTEDISTALAPSHSH